MAKDYKHRIEQQAQEGPSRQRSCVPRFLLGLIVGLSVAVAVQLYHAHVLPAVWPLSLLRREPPPVAPVPKPLPQTKTAVQEPKPKLDFYEILPKLRVETKPAVPADTRPPLAAITKPGSYSIQLGAFKEPKAAEERKARLAMLGFEVTVQTVPNPKAPIYRVKMGPYQDLAQLNAVRQRLYAHNVEFSLGKGQ